MRRIVRGLLFENSSGSLNRPTLSPCPGGFPPMYKKLSLFPLFTLLVLTLALAACSGSSSTSSYSETSTSGNANSNSTSTSSNQSSSSSSSEEESRYSSDDEESSSDTEYASDESDEPDSSESESSSESDSETELSESEREELIDALRAELARREEAKRAAVANADYSARAACMNALNRLNAMAGQGGVAATGSADQYYAWKSSIERLQADVNIKCKASPGYGTYSGSAPYSGGGSSTSARDDFNNKRLHAIRNGADPKDLPKNPYQ